MHRFHPLVLLVVSACSGGSDAPPVDGTIDTSAIDARFVCDPTTQDCPAGGKCTYVDADGMPGFERACVGDQGNHGRGDPCTRSAAGFGHDDCAPGLFCSFIGVLPPDHGGTRRCRAMCDADTACPGTERCARQVESPSAGFCGEACTPFGACSDNMTCADPNQSLDGDLAFFLTCRVAGPTALGAACATNYDCGPDAICFDILGPGTCRALCDGAHPCAGTAQCQTPAGAVAGVCID